MAFGVCATSGGFYQNYAVAARHRQDHSGRRLHPRLPAAPGDGDRRHHAAAGQRIARGKHTIVNDRVSDVTATSVERHLQQIARALAGVATLSHGMLVCESRSRRSCSRPCSALKNEFGFDLFLDVTAVDWPARRAALRSGASLLLDARTRIRVRLKTPRARSGAGRRLRCGRCTARAGFMERECHDMYGIVFRRQRRPAPDPAVRGIRRPSAAQGLSEAARAAARALPVLDVTRIARGHSVSAQLRFDSDPFGRRPTRAKDRSSSTSARRTRPRTARCRSSPSSTASACCAPTCTAATCIAASRRSARTTPGTTSSRTSTG